MKIELAKHVALTAFRSSANLNDLLPLLREHCSGDEYQTYLSAIAKISGDIAIHLLGKIDQEHPEIQREIDKRIEEYGVLIVN